ncbi:hypothetical protein VCHC55B2_3271B, partial [Vibrio cholerae HC-55B2]
GAW